MSGNQEIMMEVHHGRKNKCKTEFKGVLCKIMVSALALSIVAGGVSIPSYAADINTDYNVVASASIMKEDLTSLRNTIESIERLKEQGIVTSMALENLAKQINLLQCASADVDTVEELLDRAERIIVDLDNPKTELVRTAIERIRNTIYVDSYITNNKYGYSKTFPDVIQGQWFYDNVMELVNMGAINGYPDGTFAPNNTISYAEYLTILVKTTKAGNGNYTAGEDEMWYNGVLRAAYQSNIISSGEIKNFEAPITRADAARFTEKAVQNVLGEKAVDTNNLNKLIKDYSSFKGTTAEYYILQQYGKGILVGDDNGNFKPYSNLTRAEASTIILRTVRTENRRDMSNVEIPTENQEAPFVIQEGVYAGRMHSKYATEYDLKALETARFYKENGKLYVSLDLPELPEGFKWQWSIASYDSEGQYIFSTYTSDTEGKVGKQIVEVYSEYEDEGRTIKDIKVTTLSVCVINNQRQSMVMHKLSTDAKNEVLRQSKVSSSDADWVKFDTSKIFNW